MFELSGLSLWAPGTLARPPRGPESCVCPQTHAYTTTETVGLSNDLLKPAHVSPNTR